MFTEQELSALLGEVEKEFSSYLTKAETPLAKSEEASLTKAEDEKKDKKEEKPEAKDEKKEDKPADDAAPFAEKQDAAPEAPAAPSEDAPADAAPAADAPAAPEQEGHGYDDEDVAHMDAMYASMSRPELIAHHDSVKRALDAMGMQEQAAPPAMDQAAAAPAPDQAPAAPMMKSENDVVVVVPESIQTSQETELLKSELATKTGEIEKLNKTLEAVTAFVTKLVEKKAAPAGKAITQLDAITKSEALEPEVKTLSKKEITEKLTQKASDPKLQKSDRDAINAYYDAGQINLTGISHLLK